MYNPLEYNVKCSPEEEICNPKPREALQKLYELEGNVVSKTVKTMHRLFFGWSGSSIYQAIKGRFAEQENSVDRVHSYQQLSEEDKSANWSPSIRR
jgi:hypothetical protein